MSLPGKTNKQTKRKTAKKVGLRTESSSRFEKGLSPENALRAINRAVELVELLGAGEVVDGKIDVYPTKQKINTGKIAIIEQEIIICSELKSKLKIKKIRKHQIMQKIAVG